MNVDGDNFVPPSFVGFVMLTQPTGKLAESMEKAL
jgi:hypothetical protein